MIKINIKKKKNHKSDLLCQQIIKNYLKPFDEDVIISWERKLTLKTTKKIFIKYWTDFLYPSSDDVTIISERTNWILFYNHCEVANIWIKSEPEKK